MAASSSASQPLPQPPPPGPSTQPLPAAMLKWWWREDAPENRQVEVDVGWTPSIRMKKVALVVGSTGIVGNALVDTLPGFATPGGPWKVYAISRRALPPWFTDTSLGNGEVDPDLGNDEVDPDLGNDELDLGEYSGTARIRSITADVTHFHIDITDQDAVEETLRPLADITHLFYVAWDPRATTDEVSRELNCGMLRNVLSVVIPNCSDLMHICLLTDRKRHNDPFETTLSSISPFDAFRKFSEDRQYPGVPDLEETLYNELHLIEDRPVTWSVHRPSVIFGFTPRSARNVVASLCVYAAICRKAGVKLRWPGSRVAWEGFSDASDAELVAEHALWAALHRSSNRKPYAVFNCSNGDVFKWKQLWPMLALHFSVEWTGYEGEDQRFKLEEAMAGKESVWEEIVQENGLVQTQLDDVAAWWFVDEVFDAEVECLDTMNKSKEQGFYGFRNTVWSFLDLINKMKLTKIVPCP